MHPLHHPLVGLDGSPESQHALEWTVAQPAASPIEALHAVPLSTEFVAAIVQVNLDPERAERERLLQGPWIEAATRSNVPVRCRLRDNQPAKALLAESELLDDGGPIVVGHRRDSGHDDRRVGDVTARLLHDAQVPVIVIPDTAEPRPLSGTIALCGHGETDTSHPVVQWATRLAEAEGMSINIVDVIEPFPVGLGSGYGAIDYAASLEELRTTKTASLLQLESAVRAEHPGIAVSSVMEIGHPTSALARVITEMDPALVVIGNHHHTKLISMITDSVSLHLPSAVDCPVAAIPVP